MFESIGHDPDPYAGQRSRLSVLITGTLGATGLCLGVWITAVTVPLDAIPMPRPEPMVELVPMSSMAQVTAPRAPALGGGTPDAVPEPESTPDPEQELDPEVSPEVVPSKAPPGTPGPGVEHGTPDGEGTTDGDCVGEDCSDGLTIGHKPLETRKQVDPRYPKEARKLGLPRTRCEAVISIDERGVPYHVEVQECPETFRLATKEALLGWRWYAPRDVQGRRVKAQTRVGVTFELK